MTKVAPRRIYLDTNAFIELIEKNSSTTSQLARLFGGWEWQDHLIVTSEITIAEVLVKPIQIALESGNYALHDLYQRVLTVEPGVTDVLPITRSTWQRAATVRAQLSRFADVAIKLPDAVLLAAALDGRCDTFLTNDKSLQTATRALIERRGIAEQDSLPSIKRLVTFNPAELDTLAAELGCP